jgi:hypothetical protein
MKTGINTKLISLVFLLVSMNGCIKEKFDPLKFDSSLTLNPELAIPIGFLHLQFDKYQVIVDSLTISDTLNYDYQNSGLPSRDNIEKLIIRTKITNTFPATVYTQVYLPDVNNVLLDSLYTPDEKISAASDKNGDGITDPVRQPPVDIILTSSQIDNLLNAGYFVAKARIIKSDFPAQDLKLYSSYHIEYNIQIIVRLNIKTGQW